MLFYNFFSFLFVQYCVRKFTQNSDEREILINFSTMVANQLADQEKLANI